VTPSQVDRCTVYRGHGDRAVVTNDAPPETPACSPPIADRAPIRTVMTRDLVCARPDLDVAHLLSLVVGERVGCLPVVDERRRPIGIVTKYDLVEQLEAMLRAAADGVPLPGDLAALTVDDLMMPIAITIDEHATVAHAAAVMKSESTHHVLVVDAAGTLVGVVSAHDIVRWVVDHDSVAIRRDTARPSRWYPLEG
jgi:CBS domain-containing protein